MENEKLEVLELGCIMNNRCFHFWCLFKSNLSKTENCSLFRLGKWPVCKWLVDSACCLIKFATSQKCLPVWLPGPVISKAKAESAAVFPSRSGPRCFTHLSFYPLICLSVTCCCLLFLLCNTCWKCTWNTAKGSSFLED